jgi:exopolyphosphatase/guanosine-5'-triphosphate,3'-diphosphate pyrophosphatase
MAGLAISVDVTHDGLGVIDLGSNTILLLVVSRDLEVIDEAACITRLGSGVFESGELRPDATERTRQVVVEFAARARAAGAGRVVGVGTEALRRAREGQKFLASLEGLDAACVLSGEQEAACSIAAHRRPSVDSGDLRLIDVGGGSTEVAWTRGTRVHGVSLPLGSVRLTEALVSEHPITCADLGRVRARIDQELRAIDAWMPLPTAGPVIAVAGTATSLASMDLSLARWDARRVEGHLVSLARLRDWSDRLARLGLAQRRTIVGLQPGRADVIVAGLEILAAAAEKLGAHELRISNRGLRHGVALRILEAESSFW